mmetsp:Transcript_16044/g.20360  ORF Transcript_16044/g.20360 Transcript_16044/m.20360 type:complete len:173 (+) Transcript_16044:124-642(+)|eukprot:CAMPEP_0203644724 /NCGR_PEP_ID=MMETSP0088-20131115/10082_1 /ASSEMBLY_ACC=CAM_ASM_001087 /TAXON_ID=426623 /ORGANISM="Chaetoceros affinis, Strain CCMP159" /LENGTH=172 /DNA_ID=CAMNT_0050501313 /DNA_START=73 /DNA_END=591 /DNA_ORIENTATION=-
MTGRLNCNGASSCGLTPQFSLCCDDKDNTMQDKSYRARSRGSKTSTFKRSRKQNFTSKLKGRSDATTSSSNKASSPRQEHTQGYDSDDCSLGSLGDRNEVKQDFFLLAPSDIFNKKSSNTRDSQSNQPFFNTRSRDQLNVEGHENGSTRRRRRVFLKPRKAREDDLAIPSMF